MSNSTETPQVPTEVIEQFLKVRDSGECNMFDVTCIQNVAFQLEFYELVNWLEENKRNRGILLTAVSDHLRNQD